MRHPSERFIKFLMMPPNPSAHDNQWVSNSLMALGYPPPPDDYLDALRSGFNGRLPVNFQPQNRYHRESVRFLREEGIYSLQFPDKSVRDAYLIAIDLKARPLVENLLLGRMDPKSVAKKVNARLGTFHTGDAIEAYGHYYWDVSIMKVDDWSKLFENLDSQRNNTLAIVQAGPAMALHKLGFQQQIESKVVLKEMLDGLYFDFKEWQTKPLSSDRTRAMTNIAKAATGVVESLSQADSALRDSLKAFEAFRMKHADATVAGVHTIAPAGNYSGSGAKLLEGPVTDREEEPK
jgi:hypothetical protein